MHFIAADGDKRVARATLRFPHLAIGQWALTQAHQNQSPRGGAGAALLPKNAPSCCGCCLMWCWGVRCLSAMFWVQSAALPVVRGFAWVIPTPSRLLIPPPCRVLMRPPRRLLRCFVVQQLRRRLLQGRSACPPLPVQHVAGATKRYFGGGGGGGERSGTRGRKAPGKDGGGAKTMGWSVGGAGAYERGSGRHIKAHGRG